MPIPLGYYNYKKEAKDQKMKNQVVIITGASSGIGEACAIGYAQKGASLVITGRNQERLDQVAEKIKQYQVSILPILCDISEEENCKNLVNQTINKFGKIDILINNAGISQRSLASETINEVERKIMEINFFGTIFLTKLVLDHMIPKRSGKIAVISSIVGKFGFPLRTTYSASKHALHGYFESLRAEIHQHNVKVIMICPGRIKTNISINALTKDGTEHSQMDEGQATGVSAEKCAKSIISSISKGKREAIIGGKEVFLVYIRRFFPSLFYKIIQNKIHLKKQNDENN